MKHTLLIDGNIHDESSPGLQLALERVYVDKSKRPLCLCQPAKPLEMYIARISGQYIVKRMPDTGHLHHPACDSYEAPSMVSGLSQVEGKSILHEEESVTLKLAFSLSKSNASHVAMDAPSAPETARDGGRRLTLRSTMDYLWDSAALNRWHPSMRGKRNYAVAYKYVMQAVGQTRAKRMNLADILYMPEPFRVEYAAELQERTSQHLARANYQRTGKQSMSLLFGEVKSFLPARQGQHVLIKHAPFLNFFVSASLDKRIQNLFERELALWNSNADSHLMIAATFNQNAALLYELEEVALMVVDPGWIPVYVQHDMNFFGRLATEGRSFLKGLRFNAGDSDRLADVLLTDTQVPVAIYLLSGAEAPGDSERWIDECLSLDLFAMVIPGTAALTVALPESANAA